MRSTLGALMRWTANYALLAVLCLSLANSSFGQGAGDSGFSGLGGLSGGAAGGDNLNGGAAGAGGGSQADFSQLMQLIQTTIEPDTWEALGGPSTMFPYAAGIYVDAAGTIRDVQQPIQEDVAAEVELLLAASSERQSSQATDWQDERAWRMGSRLRCVSLKRMLEVYANHRTERSEPGDALLNVAGISRIQYVWFGNDDIVIAGPVSRIESRDGRFRDSETGRATLRLDGLASCFQAVAANGGFGCSIDPTREGLQRAAVVAQSIQSGAVPFGKAKGQMTEALGMQNVSIFGINRDSSLAWLLVEADRHMKQLALGMHPMPGEATTYLDQIEKHIEHGLPTDLMLRLWFTSNPVSARSSEDGRVIELAGRCIKLSGQNELAVASGQRGLVTRDRRTDAFVRDFNKNWTLIRDKYPVYASLESVFQSAALAQLIHSRMSSGSSATQKVTQVLSDAFTTIASSDQFGFAPPKQVETIAVSHDFQNRRQRHKVVIASGGVTVRPEQNLKSTIATYEPISAMRQPLNNKPQQLDRWWWDG